MTWDEVVFIFAFCSFVYFAKEGLQRYPLFSEDLERLREQRRRRKEARRDS